MTLITCIITYFVAIYAFLHVRVGYLSSNIRICSRIQLPVSAQWSQRLYVKVQGKMVHNDMHKMLFQSN